MAPRGLEQRVEAARRFNRFYTRKIGVLHAGAYDSPFSLTAVRVLYELAHRDRPTATELGRELGLDAGYLSRLLRAFEKRGLVSKTRSTTDGRQSHLALTAQGRKVFAPLNARSHDDVAAMLSALSASEQDDVIASMLTIERLLGDRERPERSLLLRPPQPGDLGWVVQRHGAVYAQEYGYNADFEALVAGIVAHFVQHNDVKRERCWISELDGELVGCAFLVKQSATVAKLRLLLVEPAARGAGLGTRLVDECVRFARQAGYRKLTLWTQSELTAARRLYEKAGFRLTREERHHSFGKDLVAETWDLAL
ncbi:MAG TPA: bifunctional helix-turn-helix transcriptional regulator/GNAT family N-acetyltransferase [Gemmatimonadales bacterium]|nr:bifunctional helix-turn-helix transcriptional regulator/GNAT family N-acetyltransferase [Gemmatimonadales bacterium]